MEPSEIIISKRDESSHVSGTVILPGTLDLLLPIFLYSTVLIQR